MTFDNRLEIPETLSPKDLLIIVLTALKTQYERQVECLNEVLEGFEELDQEKLASLWLQLQSKCNNHHQALTLFTEWITAQLDGGNIRHLPP